MLEEKKVRIEMQQQILTEQQKMRILLENYTKNMNEYFNGLLEYRKEKLELLREKLFWTLKKVVVNTESNFKKQYVIIHCIKTDKKDFY